MKIFKYYDIQMIIKNIQIDSNFCDGKIFSIILINLRETIKTEKNMLDISSDVWQIIKMVKVLERENISGILHTNPIFASKICKTRWYWALEELSWLTLFLYSQSMKNNNESIYESVLIHSKFSSSNVHLLICTINYTAPDRISHPSACAVSVAACV